MTNLLQDIGHLSAEEKLDLLDALWESLEADLPVLTPEQRDELDRRESQYRQHTGTVRPWERIKADLLKKR